MKSGLWLMLLTVLFALALVQVEGQSWCGGFSKSCMYVHLLDNGKLSALCADDNGIFKSTKINLNDYIGNDDGTLVPNSSGFMGTCPRVTLLEPNAGRALEADCSRTGTNILKTSTLNIEDWINNNDGILMWDNC